LIARYDNIISPNDREDTQLWHIPTPDLERARAGKANSREPQRLQRRLEPTKKINRADLINVLSRTDGGNAAPNFFDDETIPDKAIILKMPERSMKTYFIPLPVDLDVRTTSLNLVADWQGMKRRAVELFGLIDELDVYARLEFELFAFGIIPTSSSLPLLKDREVVYVNLLPPRPPTPFSLTLAPARAENSFVAEVRRPGTGLPYEVVYTPQTLTSLTPRQNMNEQEEGSEPGPSKPNRKISRFKEHMSENGSRKSRSLSVGELENLIDTGKGRRSPNKVWYKENTEGAPDADPMVASTVNHSLISTDVKS